MGCQKLTGRNRDASESKASSSQPPPQTGYTVTNEWVTPRLQTDPLGFQVIALVCPTPAYSSPWHSPPTHDPGTHHLLVGFLKKCFSKDGHDKDIDDEGNEECDAGLDEEVLIGFPHFLLIGPVHLSRLEREQWRSFPPGAQSLSLTTPKSAVS